MTAVASALQAIDEFEKQANAADMELDAVVDSILAGVASAPLQKQAQALALILLSTDTSFEKAADDAQAAYTWGGHSNRNSIGSVQGYPGGRPSADIPVTSAGGYVAPAAPPPQWNPEAELIGPPATRRQLVGAWWNRMRTAGADKLRSLGVTGAAQNAKGWMARQGFPEVKGGLADTMVGGSVLGGTAALLYTLLQKDKERKRHWFRNLLLGGLVGGGLPYIWRAGNNWLNMPPSAGR